MVGDEDYLRVAGFEVEFGDEGGHHGAAGEVGVLFEDGLGFGEVVGHELEDEVACKLCRAESQSR